MRALQALQPQIKEIQEKYKNDKQRMQQEMMRFYKENKVNPLCLLHPAARAAAGLHHPLLRRSATSFRDDIGLPEAGHCAAYGAEFLFINDLTAKATGGELIALLVLYVGTQLVSGLVMSVTADKSQRTMMFVLPLIFVPFILNFPAGLILYWITTNFWTIGQQLVIQKVIPAPVVATPRARAAIRPRNRRPAAAEKEEAALSGC